MSTLFGNMFEYDGDEPEAELHWEDHWKDMPSYENIKQPEPLITATFKFETEEHFEEFKSLIKEHIYHGGKMFDGIQKKTKKTAWYPLRDKPGMYSYDDES